MKAILSALREMVTVVFFAFAANFLVLQPSAAQEIAPKVLTAQQCKDNWHRIWKKAVEGSAQASFELIWLWGGGVSPPGARGYSLKGEDPAYVQLIWNLHYMALRAAPLVSQKNTYLKRNVIPNMVRFVLNTGDEGFAKLSRSKKSKEMSACIKRLGGLDISSRSLHECIRKHDTGGYFQALRPLSQYVNRQVALGHDVHCLDRNIIHMRDLKGIRDQ